MRGVFEGQSTSSSAHQVCGRWWSAVGVVNNRNGELAGDILVLVILLADLGLDPEPEGLVGERYENNTIIKKIRTFLKSEAMRTRIE